MKSREINSVRYRSNINQVNDFQALDWWLFDSTYHRDRRVARLRRKREDRCCSNGATRGWGHDKSSCANVYLSRKGDVDHKIH